jgi:hypothetical protein
LYQGTTLVVPITPKKMDWALQAAEKLIQVANFTCLVSGHDFSRADNANKINVGLQPLQNLLSAIRSSKPFFRNLFSP